MSSEAGLSSRITPICPTMSWTNWSFVELMYPPGSLSITTIPSAWLMGANCRLRPLSKASTSAGSPGLAFHSQAKYGRSSNL